MSSFWVAVKRQQRQGKVGEPDAFIFWPRILKRGRCLRQKTVRTGSGGRRDLQPNALIGREYCATQPVAQQGKPQGGVEPCQGLADLAHPRIHLNTGGGGRRKGGTDKQRMAANAGRRGA